MGAGPALFFVWGSLHFVVPAQIGQSPTETGNPDNLIKHFELYNV